MMSFKLCLRCFAWMLCLPLLPIIWLQGRRVKKTVLRLPEASGDRSGTVSGATSESVEILILGESSAAGVGARTHSEAMPGFLAEKLTKTLGKTVHWRVLAKNGATLRRAIRLVESETQSLPPLVFVLLGVNDVFHLSSARSWVRDLSQLQARLVAKGAQFCVFSCLPPIEGFIALPQPLRFVLGQRAKLLNALMEGQLSAERAFLFAEVKFPRRADFLAKDGVHPSSLGYQDWARQLAEQGLPLHDDP